MGERFAALDAARGFAVFLMLLVHLVSPALEPMFEHWLGSWAEALETGVQFGLTVLHGKGAALFCCLAGMSWSIMAQRHAHSVGFSQRFFRRALTLFCLGLFFAKTAWSTEVLSYFGLYMVLCYPFLRSKTSVICLLIGSILVITPLGNELFGHYVELDWRSDGTFIDAHGWGWPMLRHYAYDGSYPIVPFLVLPLAGILLGRVDWTLSLAKRCTLYGFIVAMTIQSSGFFIDDFAGELGAFAPHLSFTWLPTSIPFIVASLATATSIIGLFFWRIPPGEGAQTEGWQFAFVPLGRLSLTHYVGHVYLIYIPFAWTGFPIVTGLALVVVYIWFGHRVSHLCLERWGQGPLEKLVRALSGTARSETR